MIVTLLDTGVLWAALDVRDTHHRTSAELMATLPGRVLLPSTVLTETSWHAERTLGPKAESELLDYIVQSDIELVDVDKDDLICASSIIRRYASLRLGLVDSSVVALAQRLDISRIATLDRRHFTVIRPDHVKSFTLLPETL
ncbi:PIN domain-containing protein [Nocardiopsis gilva YIM 90087]|uniref:PIN domain-containing protein n=1 Tax=Nocardiopsis gilva YIM 90087 TaxID=1235441 RepID=A0A223SBT5_9ACTN|nr:PIN domain-containing protein [Nocardiopsis gilva]ASU85479.1 PIN domain-containing protein [Nocardiopsis gilva YIM 90087]